MTTQFEIDALIKSLDVLVAEFYMLPDCSVGGCLHVVLDDGNVRDDDLRWCEENTLYDAARAERALAAAIIEIFWALTLAQRQWWYLTRSTGIPEEYVIIADWKVDRRKTEQTGDEDVFISPEGKSYTVEELRTFLWA